MEAATTRIYKEILKGDVASFINLLSEDPLILQQCIIETSSRFMHSPLHVAVDMGHLEMVQTLLNVNSSMCLAHDQDGKTPIHVAASKGQVNVLEVLHHANRYAAREKTNNGESILHLCVKHSQLEAFKTLLELMKYDGDQFLNSKDNNGDTILHLAITTKQLEMIVYLLQSPAIEKDDESAGLFMQSPLNEAAKMGHLQMESLFKVNTSMCLARDQDGRTPIHVAATKGLVNVLEALHRANRYAARKKTNHGESILHLCVQHSQLESLKTLLKLTDDDGNQLVNCKDNNGDTILHLAVTAKQPEVVDCLLKHPTTDKNATNAFEMTAVDIHRKQSRNGKEDKRIEESLNHAKAKPAEDALDRQAESKWLEDQRSALMVVASLIATIAFQAGVNPPGGVWQETIKNKDIHGDYDKSDLYAGTAIWSYYPSIIYNIVLMSNTVGLISSLSVTLFLISGLPCKRYFLSILRITLWIAVTATAITYLFSIEYVTGDKKIASVWKVAKKSIQAWLGFVGIILLGNIVRFIFKVIGWKRRESIKKFCKKIYHCCK